MRLELHPRYDLSFKPGIGTNLNRGTFPKKSRYRNGLFVKTCGEYGKIAAFYMTYISMMKGSDMIPKGVLT